jgi:hypothetical protein
MARTRDDAAARAIFSAVEERRKERDLPEGYHEPMWVALRTALARIADMAD